MVSNEVFYLQISRKDFEFCRDMVHSTMLYMFALMIESSLHIINLWYFPTQGQYAVLLKGKLRHTARECGFLWRGADLLLTIPSQHCLLECTVWTAEVGNISLCSEGNGKQQCFKQDVVQ